MHFHKCTIRNGQLKAAETGCEYHTDKLAVRSWCW